MILRNDGIAKVKWQMKRDFAISTPCVENRFCNSVTRFVLLSNRNTILDWYRNFTLHVLVRLKFIWDITQWTRDHSWKSVESLKEFFFQWAKEHSLKICWKSRGVILSFSTPCMQNVFLIEIPELKFKWSLSLVYATQMFVATPHKFHNRSNQISQMNNEWSYWSFRENISNAYL